MGLFLPQKISFVRQRDLWILEIRINICIRQRYVSSHGIVWNHHFRKNIIAGTKRAANDTFTWVLRIKFITWSIHKSLYLLDKIVSEKLILKLNSKPVANSSHAFCSTDWKYLKNICINCSNNQELKNYLKLPLEKREHQKEFSLLYPSHCIILKIFDLNRLHHT